MKQKIEIVQIIETEINLRELEFKRWPDKARHEAYRILQRPGMTEEFKQQLFPRDWLTARVEEGLEAGQALSDAIERGEF